MEIRKENEINETEVVETGMPFIDGEKSERKPVNLRVQQFLLLSAKKFTYTDKKTKKEQTAMSLLFLDADECDALTGQPLVEGRMPVLSAFVSNPNPNILKLECKEVFSPVYVKMSGEGTFIRVHDILTPELVEQYRKIVGI